MADRHLSIEDLASALQAPVTEAEALLTGLAPINADRAEKLSRTLGASTRFWLTREAEYVEDQVRVRAAAWTNELPLRQMKQFGWITKPDDWRQQLDECLRFFGVDDFEEWQERYASQTTKAHYRTSKAFDEDEQATLVWFRAAERQLEQNRLAARFSSMHLWEHLPSLKALTRYARPDRFIPELQRICGEVGMGVAVVRAPQGCRASGATRWVQGRPLVQLSARHLSDDHFWFTFFHELGHVLRHGETDRPFIDIDFDGAKQDHLEDEADRFAEEALFGDIGAIDNLRHMQYRDVIQAAARLGVAPGLVVGQMQHRGIVSRERLNGLKRRYRWNGTVLEAKQA